MLFVCSPPLGAVEYLTVEAGHLSGSGWRAERVEMRLSDRGPRLAGVEIRIGQLTLDRPAAVLESIRLECPALELTRGLARCKEARVSAPGLPLPWKAIDASVWHDFASAKTSITLSPLPVPDGSIAASAEFTPSGWNARLRTQRASIHGLLRLAGRWLELPAMPPFAGILKADLSLSGSGSNSALRADLEFRDISGGNTAGTLAGERLGLRVALEAALNSGAWHAQISADEAHGQLYVHPVFADLSEHPASIEARLKQNEGDDWELRFELTQAGVGEASGSAGLRRGRWTSPEWLELVVREAHLPAAYAIYLQPFLVGTAVDSLETAGQVQGALRIEGNAVRSAELTVRDLHLDDRRGRFAAYGLDGAFVWEPSAEHVWEVAWQGGYAYRVGFGAASAAFSSLDRRLTLSDPLRLPVLDGWLRINQFEVRDLARPELQLDFDAEVEAVGLRALTRALRWPPFAGTLSGSIPRVHFEKDVVTVDGVLSASVFGGRVEIEDLRLADPFGVLPELRASATLRDLDLAALTSTFSFGNIEGRLNGDVRDLRMLGFSPVRFDARLYTPPGDRTRHRISQQAIENISSIGGGAGAVLSRGMLRFFESFAYDVIGWSCVLEDEVCHMDGAAAAPGNGFYLVKGRGLPQVNVVGYRRRVSWPRLVQKLRDISKGTRPQIR